MGKLIAIVGNTGVGKTTLTRAVCAAANYATGLEEHAERPFQARFKAESRYALANQLDYLLLRAEQESRLRANSPVSIQDGGLDMDFFVFTRLFLKKGFLSGEEYSLCERLHTGLRRVLPPPELLIHLRAPLGVIVERFAWRGRRLEIANVDDLSAIETLLSDWLAQIDRARLLAVEVSEPDPGFQRLVPTLLNEINRRLELNEAVHR